MKIGILSYQQVRNFGAVLQNYALQKALESINNAVEVETIDYRCKYLDNGYNKRMLTEGRKGILDYSIKDLVKSMIVYPLYKKREKVFESYLTNHIKRSSTIRDKNELIMLNESYDYFVVGSDQVWNFEIILDDYTYFLDFVNDSKKKISYAASLCWKYSHEKNKDLLIKYLGDFSAISVREEKDAIKLKSYIKNIVNVNIDPTLLLTTEEWNKAEEEVENIPEKYILFFELLNANVAVDLARSKSKELNIPIIYISSDDKPWKYKDMIHIHNINPGQFIRLVENSSYVYTNSFHGVMFSLLYHKPFYCQQTNGDRRMEDALKLVGIGDFYIRDAYGINMLNDSDQLWESFEKKVKEQREISKLYLLESLSSLKMEG